MLSQANNIMILKPRKSVNKNASYSVSFSQLFNNPSTPLNKLRNLINFSENWLRSTNSNMHNCKIIYLYIERKHKPQWKIENWNYVRPKFSTMQSIVGCNLQAPNKKSDNWLWSWVKIRSICSAIRKLCARMRKNRKISSFSRVLNAHKRSKEKWWCQSSKSVRQQFRFLLKTWTMPSWNADKKFVPKYETPSFSSESLLVRITSSNQRWLDESHILSERVKGVYQNNEPVFICL